MYNIRRFHSLTAHEKNIIVQNKTNKFPRKKKLISTIFIQSVVGGTNCLGKMIHKCKLINRKIKAFFDSDMSDNFRTLILGRQHARKRIVSFMLSRRAYAKL